MKLCKAALILAIFISNTAFAAEIKVKKLTDGIFSINIDHYTSLVVVGKNDVLVVDTGNDVRAKKLKKEILKITKKKVAKIIFSHEHFDHIGGAKFFPDAKIYAHKNILSYNKELDPLDIVPDKIHNTFDKEMKIDMGITKVELHHMGVADGVAGAIVYLPKEQIVYTADLYDEGGLVKGVFLTDTNLLGNRKILNTLSTWKIKHAVNSHSVETDVKQLKAMAGFLNDLYDAVFLALKKTFEKDPSAIVWTGLSLEKTIKLPKYKKWNNYKDLPIYIRKMAFAINHGG